MPSCWKVEFPLDLLEFPVNLLEFPLRTSFGFAIGGLHSALGVEPRSERGGRDRGQLVNFRTNSRVLFAAEIRLLTLLLLVEAGGLFVPFTTGTLSKPVGT